MRTGLALQVRALGDENASIMSEQIAAFRAKMATSKEYDEFVTGDYSALEVGSGKK